MQGLDLTFVTESCFSLPLWCPWATVLFLWALVNDSKCATGLWYHWPPGSDWPWVARSHRSRRQIPMHLSSFHMDHISSDAVWPWNFSLHISVTFNAHIRAMILLVSNCLESNIPHQTGCSSGTGPIRSPICVTWHWRVQHRKGD